MSLDSSWRWEQEQRLVAQTCSLTMPVPMVKCSSTTSTASWAWGRIPILVVEVQAMVEAVSGWRSAGTTVGGSPVLTEGSTLVLPGGPGSSGQVLTRMAVVSWEDGSVVVVTGESFKLNPNTFEFTMWQTRSSRRNFSESASERSWTDEWHLDLIVVGLQ